MVKTIKRPQSLHALGFGLYIRLALGDSHTSDIVGRYLAAAVDKLLPVEGDTAEVIWR